jgi:ribosomal protein L40E
VRCGACGARNTDRATFCTQCYGPLDEAPPTSAGPSPTADRAPTSDRAPTEDRAPAGGGSATAGGGADRDVRDREGEVEWRCRRCGAWSALTATTCATCGGEREGFGVGSGRRADRPVPPAVVLTASALLPGAGHLLVGRVGTGAARLVLWVLWLPAGTAMVRAAGGGVVAAPGLALLVGAALLWLATLVDARRLTVGDAREVLGPRPLLWLVAGVVGLMVVLAMVGTVAGR